MRFRDIISKLIKIISPIEKTKGENISMEDKILSSAQKEKDYLAILLTYTLIYANWQNRKDKQRRGYNIGSLLIDPDHMVVDHQLNSITQEQDLSQHSEVRLIQKYLKNMRIKGLQGYSIYTSLEPCAMCSGMMAAVRLTRLVYGQKDVSYGGTFEKLNSELEGYVKYPVRIIVDKSEDVITKALDDRFSNYNSHIIKFLFSNQAFELMSLAEDLFLKHRVQFKQNSSYYDHLYNYFIKCRESNAVA